MGYRRIFIIRKDLHLSSGKLAAMVGHCAEAYWTRMIRDWKGLEHKISEKYGEGSYYDVMFRVDGDVMNEYINGSFVKTICQAKNKNQLLKAKTIATELGLIEGIDFGEINDKCLTELEPENEDGTTLVGIWFKPLPDEIAHKISKKYHLYMD